MRMRDKLCWGTTWAVIAILAMLAMYTVLYIQGSKPMKLDLTWHVVRFKTEKFKLSFKTLYVYSKYRRTADANSTNVLVKPKNGTKMAFYCEGFSSLPQNETFLTGECLNSRTLAEVGFRSSKLIPSTQNVFFLETSCAASNARPWALHLNLKSELWKSLWILSLMPIEPLASLVESQKINGTLPLTEKQACSIYSAAHHNPKRKIVLLFTCPVPVGYKWTKQWKVLFDLPNFFFGRVNMADFYSNTSLSKFYHGPLAFSDFSVSHQSDTFRQFVLYMYGGTYMDLDVISMKPLDDLGLNYVVNEGKGDISAGVLNFEPNHPFLRQILLESTLHYQPNVWNTIGPKLFTDTLKSFCNVSGYIESRYSTNLTSCNIRILPTFTFFSVQYRRWQYFFYPKFWPMVQNITRSSYGIHYWNHVANVPLYVGSNQAVIKFAEKHCPLVYFKAEKFLS